MSGGNLDLATILGLLADYGRPTLNQMSGSATPGHRAAGSWHCEVSIPVGHPSEFSEADREIYWRELSSGGRRMIGASFDPTEAARECLALCVAAMEGPHARFLRPVSIAQAQAAEDARDLARRDGPAR